MKKNYGEVLTVLSFANVTVFLTSLLLVDKFFHITDIANLVWGICGGSFLAFLVSVVLLLIIKSRVIGGACGFVSSVTFGASIMMALVMEMFPDVFNSCEFRRIALALISAFFLAMTFIQGFCSRKTLSSMVNEEKEN